MPGSASRYRSQATAPGGVRNHCWETSKEGICSTVFIGFSGPGRYGIEVSVGFFRGESLLTELEGRREKERPGMGSSDGYFGHIPI